MLRLGVIGLGEGVDGRGDDEAERGSATVDGTSIAYLAGAVPIRRSTRLGGA
jgi:hypothetical protein